MLIARINKSEFQDIKSADINLAYIFEQKIS